jgi:hypothetical protein
MRLETFFYTHVYRQLKKSFFAAHQRKKAYYVKSRS